MRALFVALLLLLCGAVRAEEPEGAKAQIDALHEALLGAMQCECSEAERAEALQPVVLALFDVAVIARISSGRSWPGFEAEQRQDLIQLLEQLLVATYADRFDSFSGQRFEHVGMTESRTGAVVKTAIVRASGERVPIDYYFRGDKVFNVVADGVSDLSLRRADYSSILKEQGYSGLVQHIEDNLAELRADP